MQFCSAEMAQEISIASFRTRDEAEVVRGLLISAGIAARIVADDAGGAYPFALAGGVDVMIDEEDRNTAAAILSAPSDDDTSQRS
jgi:Putative prokaryotic signal transducing protein